MKQSFKEENKIYLTDKIFIYDNKSYYDQGDKYLKLNDSNWSKYLKEYGWKKIDLGWRKRIIELNGIKKCKYGILDCGAKGNCLFHCISEALNDSSNPEKCIYDIKTVRSIAADEINKDNFNIILETYKLEQENDEFIGEWEPNNIKDIKDLQQEIMTCGDNFWGDHIVLQLLQEALKFNVIILNSGDSFYNNYTIKSIASDIFKYEKTIILYYTEGLHFELLGYFNNNKMNVLFNSNNIPSEINQFYKIDCRII